MQTVLSELQSTGVCALPQRADMLVGTSRQEQRHCATIRNRKVETHRDAFGNMRKSSLGIYAHHAFDLRQLAKDLCALAFNHELDFPDELFTTPRCARKLHARGWVRHERNRQRLPCRSRPRPGCIDTSSSHPQVHRCLGVSERLCQVA